MNKLLKSIVVCYAAFTATDVSAKNFVEPHAAYIVTGSGDDESAPSYSGPSIGLKIGYYQKEFGFNFGVDFTRSTYTYSTKESASAKYSRNDMGLFGGYNSQNKYRFWAGLFYTKLALSGSDYNSGYGFEIGGGYSVAPKVSLNLYYKMPTYTNSNISGTSQKIEPSLTDTEIALGISFPLEI